jgi:hypothetical protein
MRGTLVLLFVAGSASAASADHFGEPPPTFHKGQLGISARVALGLRGIATYDKKYYCGASDSAVSTGNAPVCTGRAPLALDLEVAYGIAQHVELLLEMRLGLEKDFGSSSTTNDGPHEVHLSPGARFFFSEAAHSKLFVTAQAVFDFTGYKDTAGNGRGGDVGVRSLEGYWIDFHRTYGMYFFVGEQATVSRWLEASLEVGVGIQGRYP